MNTPKTVFVDVRPGDALTILNEVDSGEHPYSLVRTQGKPDSARFEMEVGGELQGVTVTLHLDGTWTMSAPVVL